MCGITAIIKKTQPTARQQALRMARKLVHRGPDAQGVFEDDDIVLVHTRLSIVDVQHGDQPIRSKSGLVVIANGELYTHKEIRAQMPHYDFQTSSDSEILLALYEKHKEKMLEHLEGIFAFVLYDEKTSKILIARDHVGIIPLYWGEDVHGQLCVASELKALEGVCEQIEPFPPGHYYDGELHRWYTPQWESTMSARKTTPQELRGKLKEIVEQQLMSDVPVGVLISGGLDSSLIAALAAQSRPDLRSYSIGLQGSPDVAAARKVAKHLGTDHHEYTFSIQEGLDCLQDVIYHLETYDVTTIRASTPMYLLSRFIKSHAVKVVLSGEGSDEIFGGYLYFHMAPDQKEFHAETVRKVLDLHKYDCLRANKSTMAWGVEARVPFLSKSFLDYAMSIDPQQKMCQKGIEKYLLRQAADGLLPDEIVWRQKEQFSDGVGYGWIDALKQIAEKQISDEDFVKAKSEFPIQTPRTKEAMLYRRIFASHYPSDTAAKTVPHQKSIACSSPRALAWSKAFDGMEDPTGRAIAVHASAVKKI